MSGSPALARASVSGMLCPRMKPRMMAAAKLSPQPTVSATGTCRVRGNLVVKPDMLQGFTKHA